MISFKKKSENPCPISSVYFLDDLNLALTSFTSLSLSVNACSYSCSLPHIDASRINEILFIVQCRKILGILKISLLQSSSFPWKCIVIPHVYSVVEESDFSIEVIVFFRKYIFIPFSTNSFFLNF